jgi:hypothetical protein
MEPTERVGPDEWKQISDTPVEGAMSINGWTPTKLQHHELEERIRRLGERLTRLEAEDPDPKDDSAVYFHEEDTAECRRELRKAKYVLHFMETGEAPVPDEELTWDVLGRRRNEVDAALGEALEFAHRMDEKDDEARRCIERVDGKICGKKGAYPWHYGWKCDTHSRMTQATREASDFILNGIPSVEVTGSIEVLARTIARTEVILKLARHPVSYGFYTGRLRLLRNWFASLPQDEPGTKEEALVKARKDHGLHKHLFED